MLINTGRLLYVFSFVACISLLPTRSASAQAEIVSFEHEWSDPSGWVVRTQQIVVRALPGTAWVFPAKQSDREWLARQFTIRFRAQHGTNILKNVTGGWVVEGSASQGYTMDQIPYALLHKIMLAALTEARARHARGNELGLQIFDSNSQPIYSFSFYPADKFAL